MRNDPIHDLTETIDEHERRLSSIDTALSTRSKTIDEIRRRVRELEDKVGKHSVGSVLDKVKTVETNLGNANKRLDAQSAEIANLRLDVRALSRKVRSSGDLPRADFHTWQPDITPEMVQLIRARLAAAPVSPAKVQQLQTKLEQAQEQVAGWDRSREAAIMAVQAMTELPQGAERAWRKEKRTWSAFRASGSRPTGEEALARHRHDEAVRARRSETVALAQSKEADEAACATIRRRVQDAVAQDLVLPHWCDIALGLFSPGKPDRIKPWLDAATKLIRYRLLADIRDSLHAYGDRPSDETLAAEYDRVVGHCSDVRR
ncbi:hypothetical protein [Lentzea flaviverrucosa]|uniref:Uncharacterized protein n=1 Tax=Lentzea flaviverrucosa TaxID=200379 RepID=A0A1H9GLY7_9PSEU|nr:hypothetical protein [Lentzea flaviverrucosa]RDI34866.1 hypothetical protein DFR72_101615 [Lentzea flaviverrucosa]SEQ51059.1 hypothetical protein SAMN05216195_102602 [Lentzea flaviverrucosa]